MKNTHCTRQTYLTVADVGRVVNLTSAGVRLAANTGRLHIAAMTPRGVRLFCRKDVEAFAAERRRRREQGA